MRRDRWQPHGHHTQTHTCTHKNHTERRAMRARVLDMRAHREISRCKRVFSLHMPETGAQAHTWCVCVSDACAQSNVTACLLQQQQQQWQARLRCQKSPLRASLPPPTSPPLRQHDVASVCVCACNDAIFDTQLNEGGV